MNSENECQADRMKIHGFGFTGVAKRHKPILWTRALDGDKSSADQLTGSKVLKRLGLCKESQGEGLKGSALRYYLSFGR